jgi:hypothetical protein
MVAAGGPGGVRVPAEVRTTLVAIMVRVIAVTAVHRAVMYNTFLEISGMFIDYSFYFLFCNGGGNDTCAKVTSLWGGRY